MPRERGREDSTPEGGGRGRNEEGRRDGKTRTGDGRGKGEVDTFIGKRVWHSVRECRAGTPESALCLVSSGIIGRVVGY